MSEEPVRRPHFAAAAAAALGVAACTVGPDYQPPAVAMPATWSQALGGQLSVDAFGSAAWWQLLGDEQLARLIARAVEGSPTLGSAAARIAQSRAIRRQITGQWSADVDAAGAYARSRDSQTVSPFPVSDQSTVDVGLDMVWEIDLFGRIRRSVESADARLEASVEDYHDVLIVLQAEVGATYVTVRTLQRRLELLRENIALQQSSRDLAQARFDTEISPELDVFQAESNLANTEAQLPGLELELTRALHRLAVLLGEHAGALAEELAEPAVLPSLPESAAIGMPAELLRRRPDIRRAERDLAAQHALIGAAEAQLYPIVSLSGALGLTSFGFDRLLRRDSRRWSIAPGFRWNLFDGGRVRGAVDEEVARTEQARLFYDNTVLLAVEEAENAIARFRLEGDRRGALERVVRAALRSAEMAQELYKQGLRDFQNVLDAQRTLSTAQDALAQSEGAMVSAWITLYRALGGGWQVEDLDNPEAER